MGAECRAPHALQDRIVVSVSMDEAGTVWPHPESAVEICSAKHG